MSINTVGIIGVGNMDLPMLKALRRAGFSVVARDLRREAEAAARDAGARIASSARDLAAISDMILVVVVVDAAQIEDALFREPSPAAAWRPGTVVALCSTIGPDDAERLAARIVAAGAEVLAMGESLGLDPQLMLEVVGASSGQSWIVDERMPLAFADDFAARAHARILLKDVMLAVAMAKPRIVTRRWALPPWRCSGKPRNAAGAPRMTRYCFEQRGTGQPPDRGQAATRNDSSRGVPQPAAAS